ncbi:MAG: NifU family protein [Bacteriovoracaceae bacterium]|nr:NifU family protein [Bacteriovoracaceae bacterium]
MSEFEIFIQPTPNPNALKFILEKIIKTDGKSTYKTLNECEHNPMAKKLFDLRGVDQLLFYQNVITVSKFNFANWEELEPQIVKTIEDSMDSHDPDFLDPVAVAETQNRDHLSPEIQNIESILDKSIRPGLQGDGGDIQVVDYKDNVLVVKYQGACGTCPSSPAGTLQAITGILKDQFNPEIQVYIAPEY